MSDMIERMAKAAYEAMVNSCLDNPNIKPVHNWENQIIDLKTRWRTAMEAAVKSMNAPLDDTIWVMQRDNHTEGYSAAFQAFTAEKDARSALNLLEAGSGDSFVIFRVSVWPSQPVCQWFLAEPLK